MMARILIASACLAVAVACQQAGGFQSPSVPAPVATMAEQGRPEASARPWKAKLDFRATRLEWAGGTPFTGVQSLFGGRCSAPSDYVITAAFDGETTHGGRVTGTGSHCTQILWTPQGPGGVTYSDGRGTLVVADGSTLSVAWGNGTSGVDAATGATWFRDEFRFEGGTGRFAEASGGGQEGGSFTDFMAVLAGTPVPMWMEGTITYARQS